MNNFSISHKAYSSVCEAHIRVAEVQALLSATARKAFDVNDDSYSALTGIERLVQGISDQITEIERGVSDLEQQLKAQSCSSNLITQDALGEMVQALSATEKSYLFQLIQDAKAQAQGVAA